MTTVRTDVVAEFSPRCTDSLADMPRKSKGTALVCRLKGVCFVRRP